MSSGAVVDAAPDQMEVPDLDLLDIGSGFPTVTVLQTACTRESTIAASAAIQN